ncbi:hypothetical protein H5410_023268 [Solanum commersonii]|uniref:Uncharacterized protein n=1 Tax=Solanum commersonii TaxID=4109 RepID=A0A9J5ZGD0_SOLCO|nr:hypothetical protein H5410_023268 [Solanum commersonii]
MGQSHFAKQYWRIGDKKTWPYITSVCYQVVIEIQSRGGGQDSYGTWSERYKETWKNSPLMPHLWWKWGTYSPFQLMHFPDRSHPHSTISQSMWKTTWNPILRRNLNDLESEEVLARWPPFALVQSTTQDKLIRDIAGWILHAKACYLQQSSKKTELINGHGN